jgi:spermidine/putrescine transport system substrate-binding protein
VFSIPWLSGTVGIVVNTEAIREPLRDWADVFQGRYAGRIVVVDDAREMVAWALASQDLPITDVSNDALARIEPVLGRWLPQVAVFDAVTPAKALRDGRADVGIIWSGEAAGLLAEDGKYQFVLPKRGAHRFVDNLAIPTGAPNPGLAERFIDHCLRPEVSVLISRAYPYTNPNLAARKLLTERERSNLASYPPGHTTLPMLRNDGNDSATVAAFVQKIRARLDPGAK